MTTKLYWQDSHLTRFTARVEETFLREGRRVLILDRTAFYPTGGGQPGDTGFIDATAVVDVSAGDDGRILHLLAGDPPVAAGDEVSGEIDWDRRRDFLQQHTGQHILSQAFFQLSGAETRGFRMSDRVAEIDLAFEAPPEEIDEAVARAEELANRVVFDNRDVRSREVTPDEAARLPLRKESFITDCVRVVEIADFDFSPCGGTHARRTGEVGLVAVRNWERAKRMTRVQFVCGGRALADYRAANQTALSVARQFSVARDVAPESVARLIEENKRLTSRVKALAGLAAKTEADELLAAIPPGGGPRVVARLFDDRDFEELKLLAHRLVAHAGVVALLATRDREMARLVFARSADVAPDMQTLMRAACERLGGRGGGKPDFAQGGGPHLGALESALSEAAAASEGH